MNFSEHCYLCDNIKTSLDKGITCKLSNEKPDFELTCPKIRLNGKLQDKLEIVNLEVHRISLNKKSVLIKFYTFIIIGFLLILSGFLFLKNVHFSLYTLWFSYLSVGGGGAILSASYFLLNNFRKKLKFAEKEKNKVDELLDLYKINYKIDIKFEQKHHGIQDVKVDLTLDNRKNKNSSKVYEITESIE